MTLFVPAQRNAAVAESVHSEADALFIRARLKREQARKCRELMAVIAQGPAVRLLATLADDLEVEAQRLESAGPAGSGDRQAADAGP